MFRKAARIIIVRHGESEANVSQLCGGWLDSPLTNNGIQQAHQLATTIMKNSLKFDVAISSLLSRSICTRNIILEDMNLRKSKQQMEVTDQNANSSDTHIDENIRVLSIPDDEFKIQVLSTWKLNECHSGALSGLTLQEASDQFGQDTILNRFMVYDSVPPLVSDDSIYNPMNDPHYANVEDRELLPKGESIELAWGRAEPFWKSVIEDQLLKQGKNVLVVCHGNIIRAIMKYCEKLNVEDCMRRRIIPNCMALIYSFKNGQYQNRKIIGDEIAVTKFKLTYKLRRPQTQGNGGQEKDPIIKQGGF